jgi:hypothetical protein
VLTGSKVTVDANRDYELGAHSDIPRALTRRGFVKIDQGLGLYWLEIAELPPEGEGGMRWKILG